MVDESSVSSNLKALLEILFWMHPNGVKETKLLKELKLGERELLSLLIDWQQELKNPQRAFILEKREDIWILSPKKEYSAYVVIQAKQKRIPLNQREIIALLYYEKLLTQKVIDQKRGKSSQKTLEKLIAQGLVEEREQGYCLTQKCLQVFGLQKT